MFGCILPSLYPPVRMIPLVLCVAFCVSFMDFLWSSFCQIRLFLPQWCCCFHPSSHPTFSPLHTHTKSSIHKAARFLHHFYFHGHHFSSHATSLSLGCLISQLHLEWFTALPFMLHSLSLAFMISWAAGFPATSLARPFQSPSQVSLP